MTSPTTKAASPIAKRYQGVRLAGRQTVVPARTATTDEAPIASYSTAWPTVLNGSRK